MMKRSNHLEYIVIINIYAPNLGVPKYIKQIFTNIKGEINGNTIIVGEFSTPLTSMNRSSRQKLSMETLALNNTLSQMNLIYREITLHPKAAE